MSLQQLGGYEVISRTAAVIRQDVITTTFTQLYKCLHNHSLEALVGLQIVNVRRLGKYWIYSVSYTVTWALPSSGIGNSLGIYPVPSPLGTGLDYLYSPHTLGKSSYFQFNPFTITAIQ